MQLKGTIVKIKDVQVISEKFKKQEVILKQEGVEYYSDVPVDFMQDKGIELAKGLKIGKVYEIDINLVGREWKDMHFISLKAWRVKEVEAEAATEDDGNRPF